jgi:putative flavoprotein involved in K+ transport
MPEREPEHLETVVIGGGQAGLSVGHHLARRGRPFLILDANQRVGDAWRNRWDSLRLFTPARYDALAGLPFPAPAHSFPTKDQVADYLDAYATQSRLPVRTGVRVDRLWRDDGRFVVAAGDRSWEADNVVVAMSTFQVPRVPPFAGDLGPDIVQLHSASYRNPSQLQKGGVLVVGAGNSGAEIALEVVRRHPTWLAGKESGHVPFRIEGAAARYVFQPLLFRVVGHRVLTVDTPIGRKLLDGHPLLADQQILQVANVIWCTGSGPDFSWIDLPVFGENEHEPRHHRGVVASQPGLYFVGLHFLYAMSSGFLPGVDRDAEHIVQAILGRAGRTSGRPGPTAGNGVRRPMRAG